MAHSWSLSGALKGMFARRTIDDETWDRPRRRLITADFGMDLTRAIIEESCVRASSDSARPTLVDLKRMLRTLEERLADSTPSRSSARPAVVLVVSVNGVGKTTTIGKVREVPRRFTAGSDRRRRRHLPGGGG
jgi:fused signal recognition particle receptor